MEQILQLWARSPAPSGGALTPIFAAGSQPPAGCTESIINDWLTGDVARSAELLSGSSGRSVKILWNSIQRCRLNPETVLFLTRGLILNMSKVVGFTRCDFTNSIFEMDKLIFND